MAGKYILALDQGTTSSRAIVFDHSGNILGMAQEEFAQLYPKPGWVEHEPKEILSSEMASVYSAVIRAGVSMKDIKAVGITNQRETTILWNKKTGQPVYNAIVWQCRRTDEYCKELLKDKNLDEMIYSKTGLRIDAYFCATKIKWILDNVPGVKELAKNDELCFGTVDTYLLWHLTGGKVFATDYTNASRTLLFNIHELKWDDDLLKLFDIPKNILPEVFPSSHLYGYTDVDQIGASIPICGIVGDQQGALFGQLCVNKGDIKNTFGTGCFMLMNTGNEIIRSKHGLITTLGATIEGQKPDYVLEGSVFIGGAAVKWLRDELRLVKTAEETERYCEKIDDTDGVYVVPAFTGLGAPYWDGEARGMIVGITRGTSKEHIIRATMEGIAYQVYDVLKAMENDLGIDIKTLCVDGGASKNKFLMQFEADILHASIKCPKVVEVTALGAAYLAGLKVGYWKDFEDIRKNKEIEHVFQPTMDHETRTKKIHGWHQALKLTMIHEK
ncbi:MAG: glycerol kinase GlpK [Acholeplasmatales bacterium]|nr:glycerol kinase GlpK [Acholeplasmatales bacterium]